MNSSDGKLYKNNLNTWVYDDKFVEWLKKTSAKYSSVEELSKTEGLTRFLIDKIRKTHKLNFTPKHNNDSNFKAEYQNYDWCYEMYMNRGMNHDEMAKKAGCSKRTIVKWCTERHRITQKFRQKNKQLNKKQRDLIIGSLLGDGHIDKREKQPLFIVSHAQNQKDYLFWKYEILKDICNIPPSTIKGGIVYFSGKPYSKQKSYRISTRLQDALIRYRNMTITELISNLNEFSFSVWVLDDGNRNDAGWNICVQRFTQEEKDYCISVLEDKFKIKGYMYKDNIYMQFNTTDAAIIDNIIKNNIPNNLDIMKDKILENDKICKLSNRRMVKLKKGTKGLSSFLREKGVFTNKTYKIATNLFDNGVIKEKEILQALNKIEEGIYHE